MSADLRLFDTATLTALNTYKATLFDVELFFAIVHPLVKSARAQGFALGGLFALQFAKFSQIGRAVGVGHTLTLCLYLYSAINGWCDWPSRLSRLLRRPVRTRAALYACGAILCT